MPRPMMLTLEGKTQSLRAWSREGRVPISTLIRRVNAGWSAERALDPRHADAPIPATYGTLSAPLAWYAPHVEQGIAFSALVRLQWSPRRRQRGDRTFNYFGVTRSEGPSYQTQSRRTARWTKMARRLYPCTKLPLAANT